MYAIRSYYEKYNGAQGNSPDVFTQTNRGAAPQPDVEDINRDNTMNTIDSYYEYKIDLSPSTLNENNPQINDIKIRNVELPNGQTREVKWYHRITSYNVCYTKLLRCVFNFGSRTGQPRRWS